MSSRAQKSAALKKMRDARVSGVSRTDEYEVPDEEDVYDVVDESEYAERVEERRKREDFVVDDDGLGYYDDGEEHIFDGQDDNDRQRTKKRVRTGAHATLSANAAALKKARKANRAAAEAGDGGDGDGDKGGGGGGTMWNFVRRGASASTVRVAGKDRPAGGRGSAPGMAPARSGGGGGMNESTLDALLSSLDGGGGGGDAAVASNPRRGRRGGGGAQGRTAGGRGRAPGSRGPRAAGGGRAASRRRGHRVADPSGDGEEEEEDDLRRGTDDDADDFGAGGDAFAAADDDDEDHRPDDDDGDEAGGRAATKTTTAPDPDGDATADEGGHPAAGGEGGGVPVPGAEGAGGLDGQGGAEVDGGEAPKNSKDAAVEDDPADGGGGGNVKSGRRRIGFARTKLGKLSAPARAAMEKKREREAVVNGGGGDAAAASQARSSELDAVDAAAASMASKIGPDVIISAERTDAGPSSHMSAKLESFVRRCSDEDSAAGRKAYLDMFYLDAWEKNGIIYLFGKVQVPSEQAGTPSPATDDRDYVSCCVAVHNNVRNLFVLPRRVSPDKGDGAGHEDVPSYASMLDVHKEMNTVLKPSCIPQKEGADWKAKMVKRRYAFSDTSVPRGETQYLKCVYDAKYPSPPVEVCEGGGEHFAKIFNGGATPLETFIVKRRLMGPSWIRIYDPVSTTSAPVSWCKLEARIDDPKRVVRVDLAHKGSGEKPSTEAMAPTPPVTAVSLKFKTIVNPKTHRSEIVSVSAICHRRIMLDASSDINSTKHMVQTSLIRPLGPSVADNAGVLPQFPHDLGKEIQRSDLPQLQTMPNERALLNRLLTQIGSWDPDVVVGHNAWGFDVDLLLARCVELKVPMWSKIGRRRIMSSPGRNHFGHGKDYAIADALVGRILCDTYVSAKELLRETTYSLTNLAATQLKTDRQEIEPVDVPQWYNSSKNIVQLARHTLHDSQLVLKLMLKLQVLPLTKQLTCIAGNLWSRTVKGNRAERNEYLLLHEFRQLKYIVPEKKRYQKGAKKSGSGKGGAKYSGGLVLEPKRGLYDSFILLLDFNSLYPSIVQEYNLCFTTVDWARHQQQGVNSGGANGRHGDDEDEEMAEAADLDTSSSSEAGLPPVPDDGVERGVLPRVIKSLVERRGVVKKMIKNEKNPDKKEELDIRQKALKLTANSMYGCLGFSHSRFYAQPIAALITALGRDTLQRTVDVAQDTVGLEVIYGDTDSIMINTRVTDIAELSRVYELGSQVKREVNRLYKTLELEVDGIFRSMLLLKKKKYAAVTVSVGPDGKNPVFGKELKGLDLVRRDWCIQSKDTGRYILDQILSGDDIEVVLKNIFDHLEDLAKRMRAGELPLEKYVITKGLSKHPNDYPDGKSQAHVHVAKAMLRNQRPVNVGDHIPYVTTLPLPETPVGADGDESKAPPKKASPVERARHPEEIRRSAGALKPDVEWYLTQQILPPIARLCEPIQGISQSILAEKLGLDSSRYNHGGKGSFGGGINEDDLVNYTPASKLSDEERFKDVEKLKLTCTCCGFENAFPGVFYLDNHMGSTVLSSGLKCVNPSCPQPERWGEASVAACLAVISNTASAMAQRHVRRYYEGVLKCDDPTCCLETRQLSVLGDVCLARGCNGKMRAKYGEGALHTQLKYLDSLFDVNHACKQLERSEQQLGTKKDLLKRISKQDQSALSCLHDGAHHYLQWSAYNWVSSNVWSTLFGSASNAVAQ